MARQKDRSDAAGAAPRVGAHRGPVRRGGGWVAALLIVIGIVAVSAIGFFAVDRYLKANDSQYTGLDFRFAFLEGILPTETPTPTPTVELPTVVDPAVAVERGVSILVLDGSGYDGIAQSVTDGLVAGGWPVASSLPAAVEIDDTVVYYTSEENADLARGIVKVLGYGEARSVSADVYPGYGLVLAIGVDHPDIPQPEPTVTDAP